MKYFIISAFRDWFRRKGIISLASGFPHCLAVVQNTVSSVTLLLSVLYGVRLSFDPTILGSSM